MSGHDLVKHGKEIIKSWPPLSKAWERDHSHVLLNFGHAVGSHPHALLSHGPDLSRFHALVSCGTYLNLSKMSPAGLRTKAWECDPNA